MLTIIYDIIYSKAQNFYLIFSIFARIWSKCLEYPPFEEAENTEPIKFVIMYLTRIEIINLDSKQKMQKQSGGENNWKLYTLLFERLCNWKYKMSSSSEVYSYLLPTLNPNCIFEDTFGEYKFTNKANEYLLAFQLLCKFEGWNWTVDVFIKQFIGIILSKWANSKTKTECADVDLQVNDNIVAFFIYLQASLIATLCPLDERLQAVEAIKSFALFIKDHNFAYCSLVIQCKIIECLLLLVPRDPVLSFTEIQQWLKPNNVQINKSIPESLKIKIKNVYNLFKPKLPNYMIVKI